MNEIEELRSDALPESLADPDLSVAPDAPEPSKTGSKSVARSAGIVSVAVMFSRVLGLIREMVFARYFGSGFLYDAYVVAFRIPNVLRDLFAEGALSAAFVKVFTDYQINKSEKEAWHLAGLIINGLAVIMSIICIVGIIFSHQFIDLVADGFSPEKAQLATTLTQIMFPYIMLVALAAVAMGVLNTKGVFGIPASASTAFNVTSIVIGLCFAYWLSGGSWTVPAGHDAIPEIKAQWAIIGMAIGTLMGGAAQFAMQIPSLYRVGFRFVPGISFTDPGVKRVIRLMTPAILGTSAVQINVMINTFLVSGIDGAQGWLSYSFRLMQFPIGLFGVAVGTAAVPVLSRMASEGKFEDFRNTLSDSVNLVFLMTLPAACGLIVLGEPIVRLIYERGAFHSVDTTMSAYALAGYSIGLAGYAAIKVISPAFYAMDDAKTPMIIALFSIVVNAIGAFFLRGFLSNFGVTPETPSGYGHVGVALATSLVALVNFVALVWFMRRKIQRLNGRKILTAFSKIAAASLVMSVVCYTLYHLLRNTMPAETFSNHLIQALAPVIAGGIVFVIAAKLLRVSELEQAFAQIGRRLKR